jgi:hypothetical protein
MMRGVLAGMGPAVDTTAMMHGVLAAPGMSKTHHVVSGIFLMRSPRLRSSPKSP